MRTHPHPTPDCSLVFPPHPAWVRAAREIVRTLLLASRRTDLTDTAVALTSEAVTNAVNACGAKDCDIPVALFAEWTDTGQLRVLVHDGAAGLPVCREKVSPEDESGRGLMLIENDADAWGVCAHGPGPGKATWFELGRTPRTSPVGCGDCDTLATAHREARAGGDQERIMDATIAVRRHFRSVHTLPAVAP
ncbi:ATP-binding protein [Streptomyces eurocidicus]|uniref:Anti-sigma regulatory factor (Ser/Thr protein kinase) n=1 Tax=Streptomyces eurocidicus TaxID=66423 RepID=A0A7W8BD25_STREU|nr:ATP-binding protein [Streptomyces eurocidicus]MBB5119668.1 anti-sigma regulatory factor (Ser/Thr protein kinase) [Streptomyces eurocidicus]MBF6050695.1 ATP-binding protein [Streptomyces eurocidicus]